jgi:hypothetical protein
LELDHPQSIVVLEQLHQVSAVANNRPEVDKRETIVGKCTVWIFQQRVDLGRMRCNQLATKGRWARARIR